MARKPRIDYEGAWHHVVNRGARKVDLFDTDDAAGTFLATVGQTVDRYGIEVHGFAIMPNHYHLLVRSVRGNLSRAMSHLGAVFTQDRNRLLGWDGPVFKGRFKNQVIEDSRYLLTVSAYIHLNPLRAHIIRRVDQRAWTSLRAYLELDVPPEWLQTADLTRLAGGRRQYGELITDYRKRRVDWPEELDVDSGWLRLPPEAKGKQGSPRSAAKRPTAGDAKRILRAVCELTGHQPRELREGLMGRSGNTGRRLAIWALARETDLTQAEIGELLGLSAANVGVTLQRVRRSESGEIASLCAAWERRAKR